MIELDYSASQKHIRLQLYPIYITANQTRTTGLSTSLTSSLLHI